MLLRHRFLMTCETHLHVIAGGGESGGELIVGGGQLQTERELKILAKVSRSPSQTYKRHPNSMFQGLKPQAS